MSLAVLNLLIL